MRSESVAYSLRKKDSGGCRYGLPTAGTNPSLEPGLGLCRRGGRGGWELQHEVCSLLQESASSAVWDALSSTYRAKATRLLKVPA